MRGILIGFGAIVVSAVLWGLFTGRWTAESRSARSQQADVTHVPAVMRIPVPWVFILAYLIGVGLQRIRPIVIVWPDAFKVGLTVGLILIAAVVAIAASALGIFKKSSTTTVPFERPSTLVTSGPYMFSRNPMYVALTLIYIGVAGTRLEVWPLIVLPFLLAYINFLVIPFEERRLYEVFGRDYREYGARVRRWL